MEKFENIAFLKIGSGKTPVFWGHGWGQSHASFLALTQSLENMASHTLVDFPGFGDAPVPEDIWGTEDYADAVANFIKSQTSEKIIWVGHSFGCRVGLQLAARHPDLIAGLFLIAAAGLPRKRPLWHKLYYGARVKLFKALKKLIPLGLSSDWLYTKFGSADYRSSGPLRSIFVKVVNEDLSNIAADINCPVTFIYGSNDTETPPDIGERFCTIISHAQMIVLDGLDHYTVLSTGKHKVTQKLNAFIKEVYK